MGPLYVYIPTMDGYGASRISIRTVPCKVGGGGGGGMVDFGSNLGSEESSGKISEFAPSSSYTQKN
jgi:hypothetical protein